MLDANELRRIQQAQSAAQEQPAKNNEKVEKVVKFFTPADAIAAIKAEQITIDLGHGENSFTAKVVPLSPRQMLSIYPKIRKLVLPLVSMVRLSQGGAQLQIGDILDSFGENIDELPGLIYEILKRGNPALTEEWILDNFDFALDLQLLIPAFLRQNSLDKIFTAGGKEQPRSDSAATEAPKAVTTTIQPTPESSAQSVSSADGTDGSPIMSGTE